jgi:hypothetical protein
MRLISHERTTNSEEARETGSSPNLMTHCSYGIVSAGAYFGAIWSIVCQRLMVLSMDCDYLDISDSPSGSIGTAIGYARIRRSGFDLSESLSVLRSVLKQLQEHAREIEEIIATLEELADQEGMRRIRSSLKEYEQGEFVVVEDPKKIETLLED